MLASLVHDWTAVGVLASVGLTAVGAMWKLGQQIQGWREHDAMAVGKLAYLWAHWLDGIEDARIAQNKELRDTKNRVWEIERHLGITTSPPGFDANTAPTRSHRLQAISAFPEAFSEMENDPDIPNFPDPPFKDG